MTKTLTIVCLLCLAAVLLTVMFITDAWAQRNFKCSYLDDSLPICGE